MDLTLSLSQAGFTCAYIYFIKKNFSAIIDDWTGVKINETYIAIVCWIFFTVLCWVRKLEKFSKFHALADAIILMAIIVTVIYGGFNLSDQGSRLGTIYTFNPTTWATAIGYSVYAFEGIGLILPVAEVTAKPEEYKKVVYTVFFVCAFLNIFFGIYCCWAWGDELDMPLITDNLMQNTHFPKWVT